MKKRNSKVIRVSMEVIRALSLRMNHPSDNAESVLRDLLGLPKVKRHGSLIEESNEDVVEKE